MFQVKVLIYFLLLHLTIGLSADHCDELDDDEYKCLFNVSSVNSQLSVQCGDRSLEIGILDPKSGDPFDESNIPSLQRLRDMCMDSHRGVTDRKDPNEMYFRVEFNVEIKQFPDNYFCDGPSINSISISNHLLNDTRKLGFSSSANCGTPCPPRLVSLYVYDSDFAKVFNNSFCGLGDLTMLILTANNIKELERDAFINLKSLDFLAIKYNHIAVLPPGVFRKQLNTLKYLILDGNRLDGKSIMELKNLKRLRVLSLSSNQIDILPNLVFKHMTQLTHLYLGNNSIKTLPGSLTTLRSLEQLSIYMNNISAILSGDFQNMVHLSLIDLSDNPITIVEPNFCSNCTKLANVTMAHASLTNVPKFISKLTQLKTLDLSNNRIDHIDVGAFDTGDDIDVIDLSHNRLSDITKVFTNCTAKQLQLDHNRLTKFSLTDFSSKLINLSITHNNIHTIDTPHNTIQESLWSLTFLNLSHNHLNELKDLNLPLSASILDVRNNNISFISYSTQLLSHLLMGSSDLKRLHLENNAFGIICPLHIVPQQHTLHYYLHGNPLWCSCHNRWLIRPIKYGNITFFNTGVADLYKLTCTREFQRIGQQSQLLMSLDDQAILCGSHTKCSCDKDWYGKSIINKACKLTCPQKCECYSTHNAKHIHVDCSDKCITALPLRPSVNVKPAHKLYVYLDKNLLFKINSSSFDGLNGAIELYLNWTGLSQIEDGSFDHLTMLKVLHLDHNNLRHVSEKLFKRLRNLTQLLLSYNQLKTVASNAFPSQLHTLHLDNNQLDDYNVGELDNLTKLKELRLHGNKWPCLDNGKFRDGVFKNLNKVEEIPIHSCSETNEVVLHVPQLSHCSKTSPIKTNEFNHTNDVN